MQYDVFICHASEDKKDFVRPLAEKLRQQHLDVWYDEFSLKIGDTLTQKIDEGLSKSRYGIVVLSHNFFKKPWAKRELNGLTLREMVEKKDLILPIWHRVYVQDVMQYSPPLADKKAHKPSRFPFEPWQASLHCMELAMIDTMMEEIRKIALRKALILLGYLVVVGILLNSAV